VAAVGTDKVLISGHTDFASDPGFYAQGVAFLFDLNSQLLTAVSNGQHSASDLIMVQCCGGMYEDGFGVSMSALGTDKFLVGMGDYGSGLLEAGISFQHYPFGAYLFDTTGGLLTAFVNRPPGCGSLFGRHVAAVGGGDVLLSDGDYGTTSSPGRTWSYGFSRSAYLYSADGTPVYAFTNPAPPIFATDDPTGAMWTAFANAPGRGSDWSGATPNVGGFGTSMTRVGSDKVLIGAGIGVGAPVVSGTNDYGAAYLFALETGEILSTFTSPARGFGSAVALIGADKVAIASPYSTNASYAGTIYLFPFGSYASDLYSDGVANGHVTTDSIADGAVTPTKLSLLLAANLARLDADQTFTGENTFRGLTTTCKLRITGGCDLAEHVNVIAPNPKAEFQVQAGMIVSIDPIGNRKFKLSDEAYDRRRIGIISGGNGVKPGLILEDENNPAVAGDQPIALSGQVWCHADASFGAIKPGDLLTTSSTPGHAMKVSDFDKARFAVLGQALTGLKEGRGWVQVLVGKE
jgi:hypothetical protein